MRIVECLAAMAYPLEASGMFIGSGGDIDSAIPFNKFTLQEPGAVMVEPETRFRIEDFFGEAVIGGFHSHPSEPPTLSRSSDLTQADKEKGIMSDEEELEDGQFELIVGIWPGKRKAWRFMPRVYWKPDGKILRGILEVY